MEQTDWEKILRYCAANKGLSGHDFRSLIILHLFSQNGTAYMRAPELASRLGVTTAHQGRRCLQNLEKFGVIEKTKHKNYKFVVPEGWDSPNLEP